MLDQQPLSIALWGARHPAQLDEVADVMGWKLDAPALAQIDRIVTDCVRDPVGPEFMAPPARLGGRQIRVERYRITDAGRMAIEE